MKKNLLMTAALLSLTVSSMDAAKVYFRNDDNWNDVYCYAWIKDVDGSQNQTWPGAKISTETIKNLDFYVAVLDENKYNQIIFNGGGKQTKDLDLKDGYCYFPDSSYKTLDEVIKELAPTEPVDPDPVDPETVTVSLRGDFDGWGAGYAFNTEDNVVYTLQCSGIGNQQFKYVITKGGVDTWRGTKQTLEEGISYTIDTDGGTGNNLSLKDGYAGEVIFTFNITDNTFKWEKVPVVIEVKKGVWLEVPVTWTRNDNAIENGTISNEDLKANLYCTFTNSEGSYEVYPSSYKVDESSKKVCYKFDVDGDMTGVQFTNKHHDVVTNTWAYYDNAIYQVTMPEGNAPKYAYDQDGKRVEGPGYDQYTSTRVYFDNTNNWEKVFCYAFRSSAQVESAWPGYEVTSQKEEFFRNGVKVTLWYYDVDDRYTHIIFNNGNSGDGNQTKDMDVYANGVYSVETPAYTAPDEVVNVHQIIGNHAVAPKAKTILYIPNENQGPSIYLWCSGVYGGEYAKEKELPAVTLNGQTYYRWTSTQINGIEKANFSFKGPGKDGNEKKFEDVALPEDGNYFIFDGRSEKFEPTNILTIEEANLPASITVAGENVYGVDNAVEDKVAERKDLSKESIEVAMSADGTYAFWIKNIDVNNDGKFWITFNGTRYGINNPGDNRLLSRACKDAVAGESAYAVPGRNTRAYCITFDPRANSFFSDWVVNANTLTLYKDGKEITEADVISIPATELKGKIVNFVALVSNQAEISTSQDYSANMVIRLNPGEWVNDFTLWDNENKNPNGENAYVGENVASSSFVELTDGAFKFSLNIPVAGTYEMEGFFTGDDSFDKASVKRTIEVYPTFESLGLTINNTRIKAGQSINVNEEDPNYPGYDSNRARVDVRAGMPQVKGLEIWYKKVETSAPAARSNVRRAAPSTDGYTLYKDGMKIEPNTSYSMLIKQNGVWNAEPQDFSISALNQTVGVDEIATEEGETRYFNLQGVEVVNPESGIYVKIVNGKATKVLVK